MKRLISLALLAIIALQANAQTDLEAIRKVTNNWYGNIKSDELPKGAKEKTIDFAAQSYSISGYFSKGSLAEGQIATIYNTESLPLILLKGKVSFVANRLYITGVKYDYSEDCADECKSETYGTFLVSNSEGRMMQYAPKKAGVLSCILTKLEHYVGEFDSRPVLVSVGDKLSEQSILIGEKPLAETFSLLKAKLPANTVTTENYTNFSQYIPLIKDVKPVEFCDGSSFDGSVIVKVNDDGQISLTKRYGRLDNPGNHISFVSVYKSGDNKVMHISYAAPVNNIKKETLTVSANVDFDESELWNNIYYYTHLPYIQHEYTDGSKYVGYAKVELEAGLNNPKITLTNGTYTYPNGDYFRGNVSGKNVAGFYIDGTTHLKDGRTFKGNFLGKYNLTSQQISNLATTSNPTQAIALAEEYMYSQKYTDYRYKDSKKGYSTEEVYFKPEWGYNSQQYSIVGITLSKETGFYSFKNRYNEIVLEVKIDKNGRHLEEIIYENDKPKYINVIESYPDGTAKTIRTYHYDSKELYLGFNYFSDGVLRSAYEYRFNEEKKPMLVRSKESHPSFTNSYTCKLYDFNGNYERTINWSIGESSGGLFDAGGMRRVYVPVLEFDKFEIGKYDYIQRH